MFGKLTWSAIPFDQPIPLITSIVMLLGGEPVGERFIEWNFVSSSKERIEQAKNEWREGRFAGVPGDEIEFIPLPENRPYTAGG